MRIYNIINILFRVRIGNDKNAALQESIHSSQFSVYMLCLPVPINHATNYNKSHV